MVDSGFVTLNSKDVKIKGFAPPANWRQHPQEWIIPYTRPGAAFTFVLRCSLQEATGRLFIHASESGPDNMPRRENIQVLGLQLANYTSGERCTSKSWETVIQNERTLMEMFREFVTRPLWEAAEKVWSEEADNEEDNIENSSGNGLGSTSKTAKIATQDGTKTDATSSSVIDEAIVESSSEVNTTLALMQAYGITRKNVFLAATVVSGAATFIYLFKNYRETGHHVPVAVAKLLPASFLRKID